LAIGQARDFGFVHVEAIAAEVAGRFASQRGDRIDAVAYLSRAQTCYQRWGATGKAEQIAGTIAGLRPAERSARLVDQLDVLTVIRASQALTGEHDLDKILATLLELLVQHAGAERGCLLVPAPDGLRIAVEADVDGGRTAVAHGPAGPV